MKYENPLSKTPGIRVMLAILLGADSTEELLELGVANNRNTLYEILDALQKENLIFKDHTEKPMPIKPNLDVLLPLLQVRQIHHGLAIILVPRIYENFKKRYRKMRNKNNISEAFRIIKNYNDSLTQAEQEHNAQEIIANTPPPVTGFMRFFLEKLSKVGKKKRKEALAMEMALPLTHFCEFFDSFFLFLYHYGNKLKWRLKDRKERAIYEDYLRQLRGAAGYTKIGWEVVKRHKKLAEFYDKELLPLGL